MKALAAKYIAGELEFAAFFPSLTNLLGVFDPLEDQIEGLPRASRLAVEFFSEWTGGELGETDARIPRNRGWRYVIDTAMYSWVDQPKYRRDFSEAYAKLLSGGDDGVAVQLPREPAGPSGHAACKRTRRVAR